MNSAPATIWFVSTGEKAIHRPELSNGRDAKKAGHYYYEYVSMEGVADEKYNKKGKTVPVTLDQLRKLQEVHLLKVL